MQQHDLFEYADVLMGDGVDDVSTLRLYDVDSLQKLGLKVVAWGKKRRGERERGLKYRERSGDAIG